MLPNTRIDEIVLKRHRREPIHLCIKRDDLMDNKVSGNKWYKLFLNVEEMRRQNRREMVTFGGAFSNHIAATSALCQQLNIPCTGIIRGESSSADNPTLRFASEAGMRLEFVSRVEYRQKNEPTYLRQVQKKHHDALIVPEGGANLAGVLGAKLMLTEDCAAFDHLHLPIGTGTTFAGICLAKNSSQVAMGYIIHKHAAIDQDLKSQFPEFAALNHDTIRFESQAHFGGYARYNDELIQFMRSFYDETGIKLDPIYTAKSMLTLVRMLESGSLPKNGKHLFFHTGGLQGVPGFEPMNNLCLYPD